MKKLLVFAIVAMLANMASAFVPSGGWDYELTFGSNNDGGLTDNGWVWQWGSTPTEVINTDSVAVTSGGSVWACMADYGLGIDRLGGPWAIEMTISLDANTTRVNFGGPGSMVMVNQSYHETSASPDVIVDYNQRIDDDPGFAPAGFDSTVIHTYTTVHNGGGHKGDFFLDGVNINSDLGFGAGGAGDGVDTEWQFYGPGTQTAYSIKFADTPEPATMILLSLGGLAALRRRRS